MTKKWRRESGNGRRAYEGKHSRRERIVLFFTADPLAVVGLVCGLGLVVKVKLVESVGEGQQHQAVDEKELENVQQHPAQRDLQRPQM